MSYNKYVKYKKQVSHDNGYTWENVVPEESTYSGNSLGTYDTLQECLESQDYKYLQIDSNGNVDYKLCDKCNNNGELTETDINLIGSSDNPVHLYVGNCINSVNITENATVHYFSGITFSHTVKNINAIVGYRNWDNIEQTLTIPNSVETIANGWAYWDYHGFGGVENIVFEENSSLKTIGNYFMGHGNEYITSIDIPSTVTSIGSYAFTNCSGLTSIDIPSGVTSIGYNAFYGCRSLTSIDIPDSVEILGGEEFLQCTSLPNDGIWYHAGNMIFRDLNSDPARVNEVPTIPNGTKFLGHRSLYFYKNNNLDWSTFKIPSSVKFICYNYGQILFVIENIGDCGYIDTYCVSGSTTQSPRTVREGTRFLGGVGQATEVTLPNSLEVIMFGAFNGCRASHITIPSNVWYLGTNLFGTAASPEHNNSTLSSVTFSDDSKLKYIADSSFSRCVNLRNIVIPNSVTSIGYSAFYNCTSLTSITIPDSVTAIDESTFIGCTSLTSCTLGSGITYIGSEAFRGCSGLTSITIPPKTAKIDSYAFSGCSSLENLKLPSSVRSIGDRAFTYCSSLTSVTIPNGVISVDNGAFYNCSSLTSVTIAESVTNIGNGAFGECTNLLNVIINGDSNDCLSIGDYAFTNCTNLTSVIVNATTPPKLLGSGTVTPSGVHITHAFDNTNNCPIYVPAASVEAYKSAENWSRYASRIQPIT